MRLAILLVCVFSLGVLGSKIDKEIEVSLGLANVKSLVHDEASSTIWVGGAVASDLKKGQIMGVSTKGSHSVFKGPETSAPISSGDIIGDRIYFGQADGGISVFDVKQRKVTRHFDAIIETLDVVILKTNKEENGLWIALKKATPGMSNWCFQHWFNFPKDMKDGDMNLKLVADWNAFSGRHPGPCTGLDPDFENGNLYYADSTIRGRWVGMFNAFVRQEATWSNFNYVEKAIVFNRAQYMLSRTGKVDSWTFDGYLAPGEPAADRTRQVDLGDRFSFELWRTLFGDAHREAIWVGSEDGELVQFHATDSDFSQVAAIRSSVPRRYGEGMALGATLVLVDSQDEDDNKLVFTSLASSCELGDGMDCSCMTNEDGKTVCNIAKDADVKKGLKVKPNTVVKIGGDLNLGAGANLVIPLSSSISVKGKVVANSAKMSIVDGGNAAGKYTLLEGAVEGSFKSVKLDFFSGLKRLFKCGQYPSVSIRIDSDIVATVKYLGLKKCGSKKKLAALYLLLFSILGSIGYFVYVKTMQEIEEEEVKKGA